MVDRTPREAMRHGVETPGGSGRTGLVARGWCAGTTVTGHQYL